jgi:CMP-N-acetylneuraminic acid synthetase
MPSAIALIGARSGSERVVGKNVRRLAGHPLLAYAIETARRAEVFDRILVSTDSEQIAQVARWYGADVPFLRPEEYATSTSPDIEWIAWTLPRLDERYDLFAIVRRRIRSGAPTRSDAGWTSCSRRPRRTPSAPSSPSSSIRGRCG